MPRRNGEKNRLTQTARVDRSDAKIETASKDRRCSSRARFEIFSTTVSNDRGLDFRRIPPRAIFTTNAKRRSLKFAGNVVTLFRNIKRIVSDITNLLMSKLNLDGKCFYSMTKKNLFPFSIFQQRFFPSLFKFPSSNVSFLYPTERAQYFLLPDAVADGGFKVTDSRFLSRRNEDKLTDRASNTH